MLRVHRRGDVPRRLRLPRPNERLCPIDGTGVRWSTNYLRVFRAEWPRMRTDSGASEDVPHDDYDGGDEGESRRGEEDREARGEDRLLRRVDDGLP